MPRLLLTLLLLIPWHSANALQLAPGAVPTLPSRESPVALQFLKVTDASAATANFSRATSVRGNTNLRLTVHLDGLAGWRGATVHAQHVWLEGRNGSEDARILQSVSNIEGKPFQAIGELWFEQRVLADRVRFKVGRLDFNNEFAVVEHGSAFLNGSMGFSPSIAAGPSFPITTPGINLFVTPLENTIVRAGAYDGQNGARGAKGQRSRFFIAEIGRQWFQRAARPGRISAGLWRHTGQFAARATALTSRPDSQGTHGWHATLDQRLWRSAPSRARTQPTTLSAFLQVGEADHRVNTVHRHRGGGLTLLGPTSRRSRDLIGLGVTHAGWHNGYERITELFYSLSVGDHLVIILDLQGVRRQNAVPALQSSGQRGLVTTLRTAIGF